MAINQRLSELIRQRGGAVEILPHREVFTAQEVAHTSRISGRNLAKVIVLRDAGGSYLMAVVPAHEHVDLDELATITGRRGLALANEEELRRLFPDCELGAMPPIGHLYGMPMYVDPCLAEHDICFQAGNHHEVVRASYRTFVRLASPFEADVCLHREVSHAG
ncbi:MAG: aminoacyl-tRNA deacylase [Hyphomicrobiales bacterium]